MAATQADLDALNKAIYSGALEVTYADGSKVKYRDLNDMLRVRDMMAAEISPPPSTGANSRVSLVSFAGGGL